MRHTLHQALTAPKPAPVRDEPVKRRNQKPITKRGKRQRRIPTSGALLREVRTWLEKEADREHVSRSAVVAYAVGKLAGIPVAHYRMAEVFRVLKGGKRL